MSMSVVPDIVELSDTEDDCVLESVTYTDQKYLDKKKYDYIYQENPLLAEFIEKCYNIEGSQGMSIVINNLLITLYNKTNKAFKTSPDFEDVLKRSISMLEKNPSKRFCIIKQLRAFLVASTVRRRIQPITLSTNLKDKSHNGNGILKRKNSSSDDCQVSKVYIVDSDEVDDFIGANKSINTNLKNNLIIDFEKENKSVPNTSGSEEDNRLLIPQKVLSIDETRDQINLDKVKKIEKEIARCKNAIAKLDEEEVDDDSVNSPYIKSEKLKAKIVLLYEQLCQLTGNQTVKKRKINLRVIEGHPEGPVHNLETFLNNNIGPDGDPPFPDFSDVVECVKEANDKDNIGWAQHQILQEARALFTQCGRALQRRRQNREWQDLLHKVKLQRCDDDPADSDPALLKRLEENRQLAVKKETEILERYTMMQMVPQTHNTVSSQLDSEAEEDKTEDKRLDETTLEELNSSYSDTSHNLSQYNESQRNISATEDATAHEINNIKIKTEPEEDIEERLRKLGDNYTLTVVEIEDDPFLIIEISDSSDDEGS